MPPEAEFDRYSEDYAELVRHPVRDCFSSDGMFFHRRKWELIQEFFRDHGRPTSNLDWIDVGCGRGELLRLGHSSFRNAAGCDVSGSMLPADAGFRCVRQEDPATLPFASSCCDFVTAVCVFHHVEEIHRARLLQEMARVLRPGGLAAVVEHNPRNPVTRAMVRRIPVDRNAVLLPEARLRELVGQAGLEYLETAYFLYLPEKIYRIAGFVEKALRRAPLGGQYAGFAIRRA